MPLTERVFVAIVTSIIFSLLFRFWNRRAERAEEIREERAKEEERQLEYIKCLRDIVAGSEREYILDKMLLIKQLVIKVNPEQFLEPYQPDKIEKAAYLYDKAQQFTDESKARDIISVKTEIEAEFGPLGENDLYSLMTEIFNPKHFVGENFDKVKLRSANKTYDYLIKNQHNSIALFDFAKQVGLIRDISDNMGEV